MYISTDLSWTPYYERTGYRPYVQISREERASEKCLSTSIRSPNLVMIGVAA